MEHIVSRADTQDLMVHYNLPAFAPGDCAAFLAGVSRSCGLLKRGGQADLTQAARTVLRDWTTGKLPFYTDAPVEGDAAVTKLGDAGTELETGTEIDEALGELYVQGDEVALESVKTKREMRKGGGLVRVGRGEVEKRKVVLDELFVVEEEGVDRNGRGGVRKENDEEGEEGDEDEDEEGDEDEDEDEDGDGSEGGEDDGESETELPAPLLTGKRKRKAAATPAAPPIKKVAFAAGTLDRKERRQQGRSASKSAVKSTSKSVSKPFKPPPSKKGLPPKATTVNGSKTGRTSTSAAATNKESNTYDFDQFFKP